MKTRHLILLLGLFYNNYCFSQVYVFIVCGNRGENSVKTNGDWKLLKTKSTIKEFDLIKTTGDNCYLGLLHTSGRSVTIRQAGTFSATDLLKKINTGNTPVASKYADFVYSKLTTVGSVTADNKHRSSDDKTIKIFLPNSGDRFGYEEKISWIPVEGVNGYRVILKNMFAEQIADYLCDAPSIKINFNDPLLQSLKVVYLVVEASDNPGIHSENYEIIKITDEKRKTISEDFSMIKSDIGEETSLNKMILASFFEDKNLLIDAATYYENACELSPDIKDFKLIYEAFLTRNNLN